MQMYGLLSWAEFSAIDWDTETGRKGKLHQDSTEGSFKLFKVDIVSGEKVCTDAPVRSTLDICQYCDGSEGLRIHELPEWHTPRKTASTELYQ